MAGKNRKRVAKGPAATAIKQEDESTTSSVVGSPRIKQEPGPAEGAGRGGKRKAATARGACAYGVVAWWRGVGG